MSIEDEISFLERVPMLALLGREAVRILAIGAENRHVREDQILFREGDMADACYVVQHGSFSLESKGDTRTPLSVGPGALLGELALITKTTRPVTAKAREPSNVIRIPRSLFTKMLESYPDAALRLRDHVLQQTEQSARDIRKVREKLDAIKGPG